MLNPERETRIAVWSSLKVVIRDDETQNSKPEDDKSAKPDSWISGSHKRACDRYLFSNVFAPFRLKV
jgi:hypothetical protein